MAALAPIRAAAGKIALWRIYLLRLVYLIMAGGMGSIVVPAFLHHKPWEFTHGVMNAMLLAMVLLALLGLRYPLKMLPLLFWELAWKVIWLGTIAYPAWRDGTITPDIQANIFPCALVAILLVVIPWDYVWANYMTARGDRLR
ncbi:MAG TPA: hypothetical protein VH000_08515 [Rhizomicrobium sp.]|jgi:hypothetical protein|nr:hypothetical protein [Rhizomicrobium sp.]